MQQQLQQRAHVNVNSWSIAAKFSNFWMVLCVGGSAVSVGAAHVGAGAGMCKPHWEQAIGQPGMNNSVLALAAFDDGSGPAVYAGGLFTMVAGQTMPRIAKWDGQQWSAVGSGMNGSVYALAEFDDGSGPALYAGGGFTVAGGVSVNHIAKWDGSAWSALGSGMNFPVRALAVFDDGTGPALYAGGDFSTAGGVLVQHVAKWDGQQWSSIGAAMDNNVLALTVLDDGSGPALYAGGKFGTAGGVNAKRIVKWDGKDWSALGAGLGLPSNSSDEVLALTSFDDGNGPALYAGGKFDLGGGQPVSGLAKWDGTQWSALDQELGHPFFTPIVTALEVLDFESQSAVTGRVLYVGGGFTSAGDVATTGIARWNGEHWAALGSGTNDNVSSLLTFDDGSGPALFVGGVFNVADGASANRIAIWHECPEYLLGDLNGDGSVGVPDLLILLAAWGECDDVNDCPADLDQNGAVGLPDLLALLANWGDK